MSYKDKPQIKLYKYENTAFVLQAIIDDFQECSFEDNLYEAGTFTISINYNIPNALKFERGLFVQFGNDAKKFGEILSISDAVGEDGKGSQIRTITGYDARYILKRRVIRNMNSNGLWVMTDKGEIVLRNLIKDQCGSSAEAKRQLPISNTIPNSEAAIGKEYSVSEQFSNLYEVCKTIATQSEIGWRIEFNGTSLNLICYSGEDKSQTVRFDTDYESLANGNFTDSSEAFSNAIYVGGKGQNDDRDIYEGEDAIGGNSPAGLDRFECWDNQSSMTTESEYEAEALSMLSQYGQTITLSGNGLAKCPYVYEEQYFVGDKITVAFSGKSAVVQILSVTEHWVFGAYDISFNFGKPQPGLDSQLQLILNQIQKASNKTNSKDSVRWYTIPTDTAMPSSDVTYSTIGFIGDVGSDGKTFTLYRDTSGTGSKTYHVYFKQLAGSGKLTLTTGVSGASDLVMNSGTYVAIIYVDENGNVTSQGSTPTDTIENGNNQPATSNGVAQAISSATANPNVSNAVGVLPVAHGGTNATTAKGAEYNLIGDVETVETEPNDDRYIALRNQTVSASNGTFRWTKMTSVWNYIKSKIQAIGDLFIGGSNTSGNKITIQGRTVNTNTFDDTNPKIVFKNNGGDQNISLTFTDYNSVQNPASLTLNGNQGGEYFIAPNVKADLLGSSCQGAYCETAAATAAKVANMNGYVLQSGATFPITFAVANSAQSALTLAVNGTTAKPIYINGSASSASNYTLPAGTYICRYDGTNYHIDINYAVPTSRSAAASSRLSSSNITIKTGSTAQAKISLQTLMSWLITQEYIPSGTPCYRNIITTWSYANNDILQLSIDGINYELQLAGVVIEFMGTATDYQTGVFRLRIHSSPTLSFTATSEYQKFPVNHIAEYICNGSSYSPTWKMLLEVGDSSRAISGAVVCSTAAATAAKTVDLPGFKLEKGARLTISLSNANTVASALTLNVNGTGAKTIRWNGTVTSSSTYAMTATTYVCFYDGTYWNMDSSHDAMFARLASQPNGVSNSANFGAIAYCGTAAATAAKTASCYGYKLIIGQVIKLYINTTNSVASPTLNIASTGAKSIFVNGVAASSTTPAAGWYDCFYDGNYYQLFSTTTSVLPSSGCAVSHTAAGTAAKVASMPNFKLQSGTTFEITIVNANSSASALTLNINGTGAKPIYINGTASSASNYTLPAGTYLCRYNGTNYYIDTGYFVSNARSSASCSGNAAGLTTAGKQDVFNIVHPIGEVYIQYPGHKDPNTLYAGYSTWTEITDKYDGGFFRAYKSGTSGDFAGPTITNFSSYKQASQNKSHSHTITDPGHSHTYNYRESGSGSSRMGGSNNTSFPQGNTGSSTTGITINSDGGTEARPDNFAIKIWERTA